MNSSYHPDVFELCGADGIWSACIGAAQGRQVAMKRSFHCFRLFMSTLNSIRGAVIRHTPKFFLA